ncbi:type II toxin-antitoxin system PrlF family antitoxin [Mycetohabitans sp. B5]|uniref:AbrB/MazE/SpoVT family DNA-binding domain-containing protein n=1 Tax=Mycetohabitans TaxID=2571159 RepID=UPI000CE43C46|nr:MULTISPECIES: type II toxin-antitoxin system PrlF family antitoxin [Mycetohabitans]MCG1054582.1 type II toxin-antitoxin system PrlF family antitoxin [Mycetohabitans sp. B5]
MNESTLTTKGQTTMPAQIRAALHAEPGTRLEWHLAPDGSVIVRAKTKSILELAGSLRIPVPPVPVEDMKAWRR